MKTCRRVLTIMLILMSIFMFFGIANAATLTLPSATRDILAEAFYGDSSLDEVIIPEGCISIGERAFANCKISKITLPSTLAYIAPSAFTGNSGMKVNAPVETYAYEWAVDNGFSILISAVDNLRATVMGKNVTLSWNAIAGVDGYRISEKTSGSNTVIGTTSGQTYYELTDVSVGSHTYIVEAYKTAIDTTSYSDAAQISTTISKTLVETIALNKAYAELEPDETLSLKASVFPSDADNKSLTWSSNNTQVATVNSSGEITALTSGTATITATAKDGSGVKASCVVEVSIEDPYLTVTHPTEGNVLDAREIGMFNGAAHQTWTINSNYPVRIETVGDWFYDNGLNTFEAGQNTYIIYMDDGAPVGTKRTGKVKFYINNSLFVTVNIYQDGGAAADATSDPTITVHHPSLGDVFNAGTFEMWNGAAHQTWTVTANCDWTITKSGTWFTVDKTSGSAGTSTLKLTMADGVAAGETRTGSITFKVNGNAYKTVNFKQVGPEKALTVTHTLLGDIFDASPVQMFNGNAVQTWTVDSNAAWTLKQTGSWFTVDKTSGSAGTSSVVLNFPDGADPGETRTGSISFYFGSSLYKTVQIVQDGGEAEIDTDPSYSISITHPLIGNVIDASPIMMFNGAATQTWTINANFDWKLSVSGDTWFSVDKTSGSAGTTNLKITINDYTTGTNTGTLTFKKGGSTKAKITIKQGSDVSFDDSFSVSHPDLGNILDQDTIYMFNGYSHQTWTVMSNVDWTIDTYDDDWFTVNPMSGSANTASNQSTSVVLTFADGVAAGETREGRVRFTYYINGRRVRKSIYIAQYGGASGTTTEIVNNPSLSVSHAELGDVFDASPIEMHNGSAEQNWTITSNTNWTIKTTGTWFTVSQTSGSANTKNNPTTNLRITMADGVAVGSRREGSITFYLNGTKYRTVNFFQDGGEAASSSMTLGSSEFGDVFSLGTLSLENVKRSYNFALQSNAAWSVTKTGSWFSLSQTSGSASANATTNLKLTVNTLPSVGEELTGSLTFKLNGSTYKTVNLKINYVGIIDPNDTKLSAPTNLSASVTSTTSAKLTWSSVKGANGYNVYRSTNPTTGYTKLNSSLVTSPYIDSTLKSGVNYYYTVEAVNSSGTRGSASIPYGPVSYSAACPLNTGESTWFPSASGESKSFTITKHGSHDFTVSIKQYNSAGAECTGKVTDTDHTLARWLTSSKSGNTLKLTAAKNYASSGKVAIVTITCGCGATHTVTINQRNSEPAPALVSMKLDGYNGFTETSTVKGKATASHLNYVLISGDTITVAATGGNYARRLTVRIFNSNSETVLDESVTTTGIAGISKTCSYQIPDNATGAYTITVFAANSTTAGDDAQFISASAKIMVNPKQPEEVQLLSKKDFMIKVAEMAVADYPNSRILPSVVTAQAILETGWGQSKIMMKANALFGVKATSSWKGGYYSTSTGEYYGEWTTVTALFRAYDSWEDCLADHASVLSASRYSGVIGGMDYKIVCNLLQSGGYATDPEYASKLISIIEANNLNNYDNQVVSGGSQGSGSSEMQITNVTNSNLSWVIDQSKYDDTTKDYTYTYDKEIKTIKDAGCGVCALANGMAYMTGKLIDIQTLNDYCREKSGYCPGSGIYFSFIDQTFAESKFASECGVKRIAVADNLASYQKHLASTKGVLIATVSRKNAATQKIAGGHILAIVDYNTTTEKYLILDSAGKQSSPYEWTESLYGWHKLTQSTYINSKGMTKTCFQIGDSRIVITGTWGYEKK